MLSRVAVGFLLVAAATAATSPEWPYPAGSTSLWSYSHDPDAPFGQRNWNLTWPECGYLMNSPVNVRSSYTQGKKDRDLPDIQYQYTNATAVIAHNNGKWLDVFTTTPALACRFEGNAPSVPTEMHLGPLQEPYVLRQFSIKGGSQSEHHINGNHKRAEIQLIHYKKHGAQCNDLDAKVDEHKGLAIMSIMVNRGKANIEIQKIIDAMNKTDPNWGNLWVAGAPDVSAFNFTLAGILPKHYYKSFYTYQGSLSAPPCTQSVTYIIPKHYITMSSDQLFFFSHVLAQHSGEPIGPDNYRLEQPMGPRMISRSFGGTGRDGNNLPFGGLGIAGAAAHGGGHGGHHG